MTKKIYMPIVILSVICIIVAALLGGVNYFTSKVIEERNNQAIIDSLKIAFPDGDFNPTPDELKGNAPATVKSVYTEKNGKGHVVILSTTKGYTGKAIGITVGIDNDGKIVKAVITENGESIVPQNMRPFGSYGDAYIGAGVDDVADVETGATVKFTETAIKDALKDALRYISNEEPEPEVLPRTDAELLTLVNSFVSGSNFESVEFEKNGDALKRVFKDKNGKGYVAYVVVISPNYGTVETETLIHVGTDRKIAAVNKLVWKTSDAMYGYVPPTEDTVNEFYAKFVGKDLASFKDAFIKENDTDEVEHVTNATSTSGRHVNAMLEGLNAVDTLIKKDMPRTEAELRAIIADLVSGCVLEDITPANNDFTFVKRVFKDTANGGYIAYAFNISRYGNVEFEVVVATDRNGKITAIDNPHWQVSDPKPEYGYNPPSKEVVDQFFARFVGKNIRDVMSVEVAAGVTNTSTGVKNAVHECLEAIADLNVSYLPRIIGICAIAVMAVLCTTAIVVDKKRRAVK